MFTKDNFISKAHSSAFVEVGVMSAEALVRDPQVGSECAAGTVTHVANGEDSATTHDLLFVCVWCLFDLVFFLFCFVQHAVPSDIQPVFVGRTLSSCVILEYWVWSGRCMYLF